MVRVHKVMVLLVALSLGTAVAIQPAQASAGELPIIHDDGSRDGDQDILVIGDLGEPGGGSEGDPDTVGGGYGARSDDSDLVGIPGGQLGSDIRSLSWYQFVVYMLSQLMPAP